MGLWKSLFGGGEQTAEESKQKEEAKNFDILKFDGIRASRIGRLDFALRCFDEALKLKEDFETLGYQSSTLIRLNRLEEAVPVLEYMAELEPSIIETHITLANVLYMLERYSDMKKAATQAVQCDDQRYTAHFLLSRAHLSLEEIPEAISELGKAIALNPEYIEARNLRAETFMQMGEPNLAMQDITEVLRLNDMDESALALRAHIYNKVEHNIDKAEADYRRIIEADPFNRQAYLDLIALLQAKGEIQEAQQLQADADALHLNESDSDTPNYHIGGMEKRDVLGL